MLTMQMSAPHNLLQSMGLLQPQQRQAAAAAPRVRARDDMRSRNLIFFIIMGYLLLTRSFAYFGVGPLNLFIGEVALALLVWWQPQVLARFFLNRDDFFPLAAIRWGVTIFLCHGAMAVVWSLMQGCPVMEIVRMSGFHYYALYLPFGVWVGLRFPSLLKSLVVSLAWLNAIYGPLYILCLSQLWWLMIPGAHWVPVFGQPQSGGIAMLGILAFGLVSELWPQLLAAGFVYIGIQMRAEWLGGLIGCAILFALGVNRRLMTSVVVGGFLLVAVAYALDLKVQGPRGRDGEISVRGIVARSIAPINPDAAASLTGADAKEFKGTVDWRTYWWEQIWKKINHDEDDAHFFLGMGYGFVIGDLGAYGTGGIRTPHNIFFYNLGYHGWIGECAFWLLQFSVFYTMWLAYRKTGQAFGLVFCVICMAMGLFGNFFETPYGAIPYYLVAGICAAPLLTKTQSIKRSAAANHPNNDTLEPRYPAHFRPPQRARRFKETTS